MSRTRRVLRHIDHRMRNLARRHEAMWRYGPNLRYTLAYRRHPRPLTGEQTRVLADLDRDGFARTSLEDLVGPEVADALFAVTDALRSEHADEVDAARRRMAEPGGESPKPYVVTLAPPGVPGPTDPLAQFALRPEVVAIAEAYYGMEIQLRYCDVWHTFVTDDPPAQSQLWHRDPEDRLVLKVFVALEDVDDGAGPFWYAPGTHAKGAARTLPDHVTVDNSTPRSNDEQMAAVVPRSDWRAGTGDRGTVLFADTRGFHKGGHARARERTVYICQFLSRAAGRGGLPTGAA